MGKAVGKSKVGLVMDSSVYGVGVLGGGGGLGDAEWHGSGKRGSERRDKKQQECLTKEMKTARKKGE